MAFNPKRMIIARQRRRLSGKALADAAGLTNITISRLENTNNEPEDATVEAIAKALDFPKEFFYSGEIEELTKDAVSFRSLTAMSAKERDAALAAGAVAYLVADWLKPRFNLPTTDLLDLSRERDAARSARSLRQHWAIGERPIAHMIKLLEAKGVRVFSLAENTRNVDAFSCWRDGEPYIFLNLRKSAEHSRFDAAHELGHLVLHKHGGPQQGKSAELEAQLFAASFLMPEADIKSQIPYAITLDQIVIAKRRWNVSASALAYRLHKLNILSDWLYRGMVIEIGRRGYRTNEPNGIEREESTLWRKVLEQLWADRVTSAHIAADLHVPADEVENLVFGLMERRGTAPAAAVSLSSKPTLHLVKDA